MASSQLATRLRNWRGVSSVREALIEQGFGVFGRCAAWLAEATGDPSQADDLLTFWNERALEVVSCINLDPRNRLRHFPPTFYRSAYIDAQIERLAFYRPDGTYYLQHPIEKRADELALWPGVHDRAELQKRAETKEDFGAAPTLKADRLDLAQMLRSTTGEYGFSAWNISADRREVWGDLHSNIYATVSSDLRFAVGHMKKSWGHPRLTQGNLPLVCVISLLADPDDHFWIGDMRSLLPEVYVYGFYKSSRSAVWGMKAIVALVGALARSFCQPLSQSRPATLITRS